MEEVKPERDLDGIPLYSPEETRALLLWADSLTLDDLEFLRWLHDHWTGKKGAQ